MQENVFFIFSKVQVHHSLGYLSDVYIALGCNSVLLKSRESLFQNAFILMKRYIFHRKTKPYYIDKYVEKFLNCKNEIQKNFPITFEEIRVLIQNLVIF